MHDSSRKLLTIAAIIVAVVAIARPLIAERYDTAASLVTSPLDDVSDPMPRRTMLLCATVAIALLLAAHGRRGGDRTDPSTGRNLVPTGFALLVVASIVSCIFAGQKRIAMTASLDFLSAILLAWIIGHSFHQHRLRVVLVAGILAVGAVEAVEAFEQYFWQFPDTWAEYLRIKETLWSRQGIPLDSATVTLFERRLQASEATGTMSHSNVAGSYFVMIGFLAAGVMIAGLRERSTESGKRAAIVGGIVTALLAAALALTHSRGAMLSVPAAGTACLIGTFALRRCSISHRNLVLFGWVAAGMIGLGVVGYGLARDRLPTWSLTFRWHYWKTSAAMIADHPLTGVGRENFGRHYVRYKPAEYPEEVANPHNLFVQVAAELGLPGLLGFVLLLVGGSFAIVSPPQPAKRDSEEEARAPPLLLTTMLLAAAVTGLRLLSLDTTSASLLYYAGVKTALVFGVSVALLLRALQGVSAESLRLIVRMGAVGLLAAIVHDTINFALFAQPTMTIFACIAGLACFSGAPSRADERSSIGDEQASTGRAGLTARPRGSVAVAGLGWVWAIFVMTQLFTQYRAEGELLAARRLTARSTQHGDIRIAEEAVERYARAAQLGTLDPTPLVERAGLLRQLARSDATSAHTSAAASIASLRAAIGRDPHSTRLRRLLATSLLEDGRREDRTDLLEEAVQAARDRIKLYPESEDAHAALGECLLALGRKTGNIEALAEAEAALEKALELDQRRLWADELRKMPESERKRISELAKEARDLRNGSTD